MKGQNKQQISFSWDIHYACNYRCPYCWFHGKWQQLSGKNKYYSISELLKFWNNIYKKYGSVQIQIIGGEPFIYPNFSELIKEISSIHHIGVTSNLSVNLEKFIKEINNPNINITGTFHPLFANFDNFVKNMLALKENGKNNSVWYLAYPPQIKLIPYYRDKFKKYGIEIAIMTFWGEYNGIQYPQGYSEQERAAITPNLGSREGARLQLDPKAVKKKLCRAGQVYADIKADGSVYRCGGIGSRLIGNFFQDNFQLLGEPLPCDSEFCPCNEWANLLIEEESLKKNPDGRLCQEVSSTQEPRSQEIKAEIDRDSFAPHNVFITWDIHYACNYNCTYCNTPKPWHQPGKWERDRDKVTYPSVDKWLWIWKNIYKRYGSCEIHITGGEPFIYPSFMELITQLSQMHTLEIITNLFWDPGYFIKKLSPDRVRIGTSFHPEFADLDEFLERHMILRERGFETWANYVAYPLQMDEMGKYKSEFDRLGISFNIQPYLGWYQDREYPAGYTNSELTCLKSCYSDEDIINKKTIEWKTGAQKRNMQGRRCRMGQMYAKVYPTADAYRCCAQATAKLGNLIEGSFKLLDEPLPCESEHCFCWRCMLAGEENNWAQHWVIPHNINAQKAAIKA